jgi:hypothetical protein
MNEEIGGGQRSQGSSATVSPGHRLEDHVGRNVRTVLALSVTVAVALSIVSPERTGAGVVSTHGRQATPEGPVPGSSLAEMLALAPDLPFAADQAGVQLAQFADSAAQMAAVGVETPVPGDDDSLSFWLWANWWMPFPDPLRHYILDERWIEHFGFDATQIDRSLLAGEPPFSVAIYQGRFDEAALRTAWEASGYQPLAIPGALAYSLAEDESIDLTNEVHQLALASMNNLALLPDGTLIAASRLDNLERALATIRGEAPSLLDRPDVAALVAAGDPGLIAAYLVTGEAVRAVDSDEQAGQVSEDEAEERATAAAQERARLGVMPEPELALVGLTAGGPLINERTNEAGTPEPFLENPPRARFVVSLLFADRAAAETAGPIVESRLETGASRYTGRPFGDYFATWAVQVAAEAPVLVVDISFVEETPPDVSFFMFIGRDLGFVAW